MNNSELKGKVNELIKEKKYDGIQPLLLKYKDITEHDNDLAIICYLCTIHEQEKNANKESFFSKVTDIDTLIQRYTYLKFYLRRIDFDVIGSEIEEFYQYMSQNKISAYELLRVIDFSVVHKDKVLQVVKGDKCSENALLWHMDSQDNEEARETVIDFDKEICFIICTNNQVYLEECIYYIRQLNVPIGFRIDILTVTEACSMTSGYNEAMQCSRAKYKVYLHQDVFIVNSNFIQDFLDVFAKDSRIGMIGNVGVEAMPTTGVMWDGMRYGMLYEQHIYETGIFASEIDVGDYMVVDAIDGFIMITQYDIPWREDLFKKWDFYDASQSMEFKQRGYKVVIPSMKEPWCVHDSGFLDLTNYECERKKFVEEYNIGTL